MCCIPTQKMEIQIPANAPNQYETPCTVEVSHSDGRMRLYSFSDFQLAYMWVQDFCGPNPEAYDITPFQQAADELTAQFQQRGHRAYTIVAAGDHTQVMIYYGSVSYT
jgi:hypothetical protein